MKVKYDDGNTYFGQSKDHMKEGYGTFIWCNGNSYAGQYSQDCKHGYGIFTWADGGVYYGQYKKDNRHGYAYQKWADGDEYYGQYRDGMLWGKGVFKENEILYKVEYDQGYLISKTKY